MAKREKCVDHFNKVTEEMEYDSETVYLKLIARYLAEIADALSEKESKAGDTDGNS